MSVVVRSVDLRFNCNGTSVKQFCPSIRDKFSCQGIQAVTRRHDNNNDVNQLTRFMSGLWSDVGRSFPSLFCLPVACVFLPVFLERSARCHFVWIDFPCDG